MRKFVPVLLSILMLFGCFAVSVNAASSEEIAAAEKGVANSKAALDAVIDAMNTGSMVIYTDDDDVFVFARNQLYSSASLSEKIDALYDYLYKDMRGGIDQLFSMLSTSDRDRVAANLLAAFNATKDSVKASFAEYSDPLLNKILQNASDSFLCWPLTGQAAVSIEVFVNSPIGAALYILYNEKQTAYDAAVDKLNALKNGMAPTPVQPAPSSPAEIQPVIIHAKVAANLRSVASTSGKNWGTVAKGAELVLCTQTVAANGNVWYMVKTTHGRSGWLIGSTVTFASTIESPANSGSLQLQAKSGAILRSIASASGKNWGKITSGAGLALCTQTVAANGNVWYMVKTTDGRSGWLIGASVKFVG